MYKSNGILHMLDRNRKIKEGPERLQNTKEQFDVIITAEERVYDQVFNELRFEFKCTYKKMTTSMKANCNIWCTNIDKYNLFCLIVPASPSQISIVTFEDEVLSVIKTNLDIYIIYHFLTPSLTTCKQKKISSNFYEDTKL